MSDYLAAVVVCTYNRARYLERCIESLCSQDVDATDYEIIVVDNNSTDRTPEVCERHAHRSNFRCLLEPVQGLSRARNRGFEAARAPIVAYIDDDGVASPSWVRALLGSFDDESVGAAGGPIFPVYEGPLPSWFDETLLPLYSCRDRGSEAFDLRKNHFFYGVNMAIRKEILERAGGFRVDLGRKGDSLMSDEEVAVFKEVERGGYRKRYAPDARVDHHVPVSRLDIRWLLRRFFCMGMAQAIRDVEAASSAQQHGELTVKKVSATANQLRSPDYRAGKWTPAIPLSLLGGYMRVMLMGTGR